MLEHIASLKAYKDICKKIRTETPPAEIFAMGLQHSVRYPTAAALYETLGCPVLYITEKPEQALLALDEFSFWDKLGDGYIFPEPEPLFYETGNWSDHVRRERVRVLTRLTQLLLPSVKKPEKMPFIAAPLRAVMQRTVPRLTFFRGLKSLKPEQQVSMSALMRQWSGQGYEAVDTVLESGQYSKRGGLLDIWPHSEAYPIRLDFFGDEIDSIHRFDPSTQRNITPLERVVIPAASEVILPENPEVEIIPETPREFYLPYLYPESACLMDYLPKKTLIILEDRTVLSSAADELELNAEAYRKQCIEEGTLTEDYPDTYVSYSELEDRMQGFRTVDFGRSEEACDSRFAECFSPEERFGGMTELFEDFLAEREEAGEQVWVVSRQVDRLKKDAPADPAPVFLEGALTEGFALREDSGKTLHFLTDSEIFGWARPQPRRGTVKVSDTPEKYYADLKVGDYVVHIDYGIGVYMGLVSRKFDDVTKEYLMVRYADDDLLYVPVHQADRLSNYIGPNGNPPALSHLGGKDWLTTKSFVRENVLQIADDLLELYAERQITPGFAFSPDNSWMRDLEGAFPFEETEDQKEAIRKVKEDMERARPMDRLICGDVGYGKTEIALRAAFKAACDSKQVAILVPTTVLAQQHYETFRQRFAPYPVRVEMISRFRSPKEQARILERLAKGEIDVIIGTHRLISRDIQFKDLGLVIIDEEQRFGVKQKEHLKMLRSKVDVLTMTATPIPRTLYMALTGVRDISNINTPPYDRLPITTYVGPYSEKLVKQAVHREMERKGQVFFVHNRVKSIYGMEGYLHRLVPEARIGVAHGQMDEKELSRVMDLFYKHEIDVLLCTSIIESGLDVPNANTLIVNKADMFGLAQLYQIRGRVGRSSQRAYAYFFRQKGHRPTEAGLERLEVIAENTQFGAGYAIAMRDLEMRGAGELLGSRQHGAIASVGFHLYTRMLAQAVRNVRTAKGIDISDEELGITREMAHIFNPITLDFPFDAGIPETYVEEERTRIKLYRRMSAVTNEADLDALQVEFTDRFGPLPLDTENLFFLIRVKIIAERIGLKAVVQEGADVVLRFGPLPANVESRGLPQFSRSIRACKNSYRIVGLDLESDNWKEPLLDLMAYVERKLKK